MKMKRNRSDPKSEEEEDSDSQLGAEEEGEVDSDNEEDEEEPDEENDQDFEAEHSFIRGSNSSSSTTGAAVGVTLQTAIRAPVDPETGRSIRHRHYSVEDLPRSVIEIVLDPDFRGTRVTSAECGVRGRSELLIVEHWAILLVDRKSPFVSKNAKDFLTMLWALKDTRKDPNIRGGIICRETMHHRLAKTAPFARSTQEFLLDHGVVLLSIPDQGLLNTDGSAEATIVTAPIDGHGIVSAEPLLSATGSSSSSSASGNIQQQQ